LCIFPLETDAELRCQFDHVDLWARVRGGFGNPLISQTVMSIDRAFSVSKYADLSCLVVGKRQPVEQKDALVVADSRMDRWKTSELVKNIVDMIQQHKPTVLVGEQDKGWQELDEAIRKECMRRGVQIPWIRFVVTDQTEKAKAKRVKKLELPISDGRLWFVGAHWIEAALQQLEKFDGVTSSNSHRKDDFPDALAILWDAFGPKVQEEIKEEDPETKARKEQQRENDEEHFRRTQMHSRMFGNEALPRVQTRTEWEAMQRGGSEFQPPVTPAAPAAYHPGQAAPRGGGFASLPTNMRGRPQR
jgi:predicted phage terminase large subunit-like protein